jgi:hypothetical protein
MKTVKIMIIKFVDITFCPLTLISAIWLRFVRANIIKFWRDDSVISKKILLNIGVFPILDHYYEPLFNMNRLKHSLRDNRPLEGIQFNIPEQLILLKSFNYNPEIIEIAKLPESEMNYSFSNDTYLSGDSDYLYNIIRYSKPKRIIEIGSGHSTLMAQHALSKNYLESTKNKCDHICIEPFENKWLENLPVKVVRKLVEECDLDLFKSLGENDILFIDSSHIIRPQGDVLFEYLRILPALNKGVIVHIHDIFSPKDYLDQWYINGTLFWNEQYILEAFLTMNESYKVIGALNYLKHNNYNELLEKCPMLSVDREPGSFWIKKIK